MRDVRKGCVHHGLWRRPAGLPQKTTSYTYVAAFEDLRKPFMIDTTLTMSAKTTPPTAKSTHDRANLLKNTEPA